MRSVEMNISILQQSQVQSKPDLQPAAVKNPKFRKGRRRLEELRGVALLATSRWSFTKVYKEGDEGKLQTGSLQSASARNRKIFNKPQETVESSLLSAEIFLNFSINKNLGYPNVRINLMHK